MTQEVVRPTFRNSWRADLAAAISVALVALPLGLGIAAASDAPPISGILSAVAGGVVATFVRGSHVAINGPANTLIVVVAAAMAQFREGDDSSTARPYLAAAVVLMGLLQILLGMLRVGSLASYMPSSVIYGMLAAVGLVICAKQAHVAVGQHSHAPTGLEDIYTLPESIGAMNPLVAFIALGSLGILALHPRLKAPSLHYIPAPLMVLGFAIPAALLFGFRENHILTFFGQQIPLDQRYLVSLPERLHDAIVFPDFGKLHMPEFWLLVLTLTFMGSLESLLSCQAVDRLDPFKRKSNLNRDLVGVGLATMVSGALGGLPVVTVIARSSVNVNHGARTGLSNFLHGVLLLALVLAVPNVIREVPLAALAAVLMFAGYKLTSPKVFREAHLRGRDQLISLLVTLIFTLSFGLLTGIGVGLLTVIFLHWRLSGLTFGRFLVGLMRPGATIDSERLRVGALCNFLTVPHVQRLVSRAPADQSLVLDFSRCRLIDGVALEVLQQVQERKGKAGGRLELVGLAPLHPLTEHPLALRHRQGHPLDPTRSLRLTPRQARIRDMALHHAWSFRPELDWHCEDLLEFQFFLRRPLLFRTNLMAGRYEDLDVRWEAMDLTFDEGVYLAAEEHHVTVQVLHLPREIPVFTMDMASLIGDLLSVAGVCEDFPRYPDFPRDWLVTGPDHQALRRFFTPQLVAFFQEEEHYHVESTGHSLLVFRTDRLASARELTTLLHHGEHLARAILTEARD